MLKELKHQEEHVRKVTQRIDEQKANWFKTPVSTDGGATAQTNSPRVSAEMAVFHHCLLPRCLLSAGDAIFAAKFGMAMHKWKVPQWSTLRYLQGVRFFVCLTPKMNKTLIK